MTNSIFRTAFVALSALALSACGEVEYEATPRSAALETPAVQLLDAGFSSDFVPRGARQAVTCGGPVNSECPTGTVCCWTSLVCVPVTAVGDCEASTLYEVEPPSLEVPDELPDPAELRLNAELPETPELPAPLDVTPVR